MPADPVGGGGGAGGADGGVVGGFHPGGGGGGGGGPVSSMANGTDPRPGVPGEVRWWPPLMPGKSSLLAPNT